MPPQALARAVAAASGLALTVGPGSPEQATFSLAKPR